MRMVSAMIDAADCSVVEFRLIDAAPAPVAFGGFTPNSVTVIGRPSVERFWNVCITRAGSCALPETDGELGSV